MVRIFFDTEFTSLSKDADLISIGFVSEAGDMLYCEVMDYDQDKCSDWVKDNVLPKIGNPDFLSVLSDDMHVGWFTGTKKQVGEKIHTWLGRFGDQKIQFVADCSHYDFVLLVDLLTFGDRLNLPDNISKVCDDLNFYIAGKYSESLYDAFDRSRERIFNDLYSYDADDAFAGNKHNALYDAFVVWKVYQALTRGRQW